VEKRKSVFITNKLFLFLSFPVWFKPVDVCATLR